MHRNTMYILQDNLPHITVACRYSCDNIDCVYIHGVIIGWVHCTFSHRSLYHDILSHVCVSTCCIFCFFCFCYLFLRGDPLSRRLLFRGPTKSLQIHTYTITDNQIYTHTLCGQWQHFFSSCSGCRAGFEPRASHSSCSASSLNHH